MAVCHIVWEVYIDERTIIAYFNSKKGVHFLNINTLIVFCDPKFENINNLRNYHWYYSIHYTECDPISRITTMRVSDPVSPLSETGDAVRLK